MKDTKFSVSKILSAFWNTNLRLTLSGQLCQTQRSCRAALSAHLSFCRQKLRRSFWIRTNAVSALWCCRYALWKMYNKSLLSRCWRSCTATWRSSNFDTRKNRDADGAADSSDDNQPDPSGWQADAAENPPDTEAENDSGSSMLLSSDDELTPQSHANNKKTVEIHPKCILNDSNSTLLNNSSTF